MRVPDPDDQRDVTALLDYITRATLLAQAMTGRNRLRHPDEPELLHAQMLGKIVSHLAQANGAATMIAGMVREGDAYRSKRARQE